MRIYIMGIDGYLGWALALHLKINGYEVFGCDSFLRRELVKKVGGISATPIKSMDERLREALINFYLTDIENLEKLLGRDLSHWKR